MPPRALSCAGSPRRSRSIKLYNAGSFFDPRAVPEHDYDAVAMELAGLATSGRRIASGTRRLAGSIVVWRHWTVSAIGAATIQLEVAMGLETVHPEALDRLEQANDGRGLRSRG